jgi:radical SAM/Cys-rich protein
MDEKMTATCRWFEENIAGRGFDDVISGLTGEEGLRGLDIGIIQVNLGLRCNQSCAHCHVAASPNRTEMMSWRTMEAIAELAVGAGAELVDLTGGAPELHPDFRRFVTLLREHDLTVQVRTNLSVLLEPGMKEMPEFFRANGIRLAASMPCYLEENVRAQRGGGVYDKSVEAIRRLNELGYGSDPELPLDLVYNPGGPFLPPDQSALQADYKRELGERFGISFTRLLTIANMPIGRFLARLRAEEQERSYMELLRGSFNADTLDELMCRHQINIGWDGTIYDCDFNLALGLPVDHGAPDHIKSFDKSALAKRRIVTGEHCYGCTAGGGSSCRGALV